MKKLFTFMCACATMGFVYAQEDNGNSGNGVLAEYQLPNADFEENWTLNEFRNSEDKVTYSEETPDSWNSFYTAGGDFASLALKLMADQVGSVKKTVGYDGKGSAALIFSRKNLYQSISNGNLTNGIINMGSYVASDSKNYNYSDLDNPTGHCEFVGLPDSVSVYFKFEPTDASKGKASMNMILHSEYEYKDPGLIMGTEDSLKYLVAIAKTAVSASDEWVRYSVPFEYNGENYKTDEKRYMLVSFSTNEQPGMGSHGDSLSIDHIRLVYNSQLKSLNIDGVDIVGIEGNVFDYVIEDDVPTVENVVAVADGIGASVETAVDGNVLTVTVKGNDFAVNPENVNVYRFTFDDGTGIVHNELDNVSVAGGDGYLIVSGADGETVEIFNIQGMKIGEFIVNGNDYKLDIGISSMYIVKVGSKVYKVLL